MLVLLVVTVVTESCQAVLLLGERVPEGGMVMRATRTVIGALLVSG